MSPMSRSRLLMAQGFVDCHLCLHRELGILPHSPGGESKYDMVAAFPIFVSISLSRVRSLLIVDPRYVNCFTTPSSLSPIVMIGDTPTSCPKTFVFFTLIVIPMSLQAPEKRFIRNWSSSCLGCGGNIIRKQHITDQSLP